MPNQKPPTMSTVDTLNSLVTLLVFVVIPACIYLALQARENRKALELKNRCLRYELETQTQIVDCFRRVAAAFDDTATDFVNEKNVFLKEKQAFPLEEQNRNGRMGEAETVGNEKEETNE